MNDANKKLKRIKEIALDEVDLQQKKNNVVVFPFKAIENNSTSNSNTESDIDAIIQRLFVEAAKLDVIHEVSLNIVNEKFRKAIAERTDALKIILFDLRMLKIRKNTNETCK